MKINSAQRLRLGDFEVNIKTGEVRPTKAPQTGRGTFLQEKSLRLLRMLMDKQGELVPREEIQRVLWPNDTVVDFDHGIHVAVATLRRALGDSAASPQYIETVPRRGYRLLVPVEEADFEEPSEVIQEGDYRSTNQTVPSLIGRSVSHFRVLALLGAGGMGTVYEAEDMKLGRKVALKFLPEEMAHDPTALKRFEGEARTASSLNHRNICTIYAVEEFERQPVIVMELLDGETLRDRLARITKEPLSLDELLDIALQTCDGLAAAHSGGIVHRDIKPANLFLTKTDGGATLCVKILDFGLAKLIAADSPGELPGVGSQPDENPRYGRNTAESDFSGLRGMGAAGTASYMSPEQIRRERLDPRTDLFSFGLVLYEMATGQRASPGDDAATVKEALLNKQLIPVRRLNPLVPAALETVIVKALQKDRDQRYLSVEEIRTEVNNIRSPKHYNSIVANPEPWMQEKATVADSQIDHSFRSSVRYKWVAGWMLLLLLIAIGVVVAGLVAFWRSKPAVTSFHEPQHLATGFDSVISPNGKLVAYVSTIGSQIVPHIWVREAAGNIAYPLTSGPYVDIQPNFSPDGSLIAYYSERNGGGIYVSPPQQDNSKFVAKCNYCMPRFSPRGDKILFRNNLGAFTVSLKDSRPVPLALNQDFELGSSMFWGPDGKRILFYGNRKNSPDKTRHWWIAPIAGGAATLVTLPGLDENPASIPAIRDWIRTKDGRDWIYYAHLSANTWRLMRVEVSATGEMKRAPNQIASGTGLLGFTGSLEGGSGSKDGDFVYETNNSSGSIFIIPTNNQGTQTGPIDQLHVSGGFDDRSPAVSHDGRWMVYDSSDDSRTNSIFLRDMTTGTERLIDDRGRDAGWGGDTAISDDGAEIMFGRDCKYGVWSRPTGGRPVPCGFLTKRTGGDLRQVCESCAARGFVSSGSIVLIQKYGLSSEGVFTGRASIDAINLKTGSETSFLNSKIGSVYTPFLSWDNRWIVFDKQPSPRSLLSKAQIFIAPVRDGVAADEDHWIPITDGRFSDGNAQFSPDGNKIYFTSTRDGYLCIWSQRLDPLTKLPIGPPIAFEHFHNSMGHIAASSVNPAPAALAVTRNKVVISLPQQTSDIWLLKTE